MIVIANSSPLVALGRVRQLQLFHQLFQKVYIRRKPIIGSRAGCVKTGSVDPTQSEKRLVEEFRTAARPTRVYGGFSLGIGGKVLIPVVKNMFRFHDAL